MYISSRYVKPRWKILIYENGLFQLLILGIRISFSLEVYGLTWDFTVWVFQQFLVICHIKMNHVKFQLPGQIFFFLILWYLNKIILVIQELAVEKVCTSSPYFLTNLVSLHVSLTLILLDHILKSFRPQSHALGMHEITKCLQRNWKIKPFSFGNMNWSKFWSTLTWEIINSCSLSLI